MPNVKLDTFESLEEYIRVIGSRPKNKVMQYKDKSVIGDKYFTGTNSYEEATELALKGYKDGLKAIISNTERRFSHRENANRRRTSLSVQGYAPHVANAIIGLPKSMISTTTTAPSKDKVLTICYLCSVSHHIEAKTLNKAGENLLNAIRILELSGYRVGLYVMVSQTEDDEYLCNLVKIKDYKQQQNPLKMAYPLVNASYFRRHGFRWIETNPSLTNGKFASGYGVSIIYRNGTKTVTEQREFLKKHGILKSSWFYTNVEQAATLEPEALLTAMEIK